MKTLCQGIQFKAPRRRSQDFKFQQIAKNVKIKLSNPYFLYSVPMNCYFMHIKYMYHKDRFKTINREANKRLLKQTSLPYFAKPKEV